MAGVCCTMKRKKKSISNMMGMRPSSSANESPPAAMLPNIVP